MPTQRAYYKSAPITACTVFLTKPLQVSDITVRGKTYHTSALHIKQLMFFLLVELGSYAQIVVECLKITESYHIWLSSAFGIKVANLRS